MSLEDVLVLIDAELARLNQARTLLASLDTVSTTAKKSRKRNSGLTAAGRKRIAEAQKKRWAAIRKQSK